MKKKINEKVQLFLVDDFKRFILNTERLKKFKVEEYNSKIEAVMNRYSIYTERRLVFLREQAEIARDLNIPKYLKYLSTTDNREGAPTIYNDYPYYTRGYQAIQKEIELIEKRTDNKAFAGSLLSVLETKQADIILDKSVEKFKKLFNETPLVDSNDFVASKLIIKSTKQVLFKDLLIKKLTIVFIISFILSIIWVLIFYNRKT